jgi:uncharacterized protein (DUF2267 family)
MARIVEEIEQINASDDLDVLKVGKQKIENERRLLDLRRDSGELVERAAVRQAVEAVFSAVRARLQALPGEIGAGLPADLRSSLIAEWAERIDTALRELSNYREPV